MFCPETRILVVDDMIVMRTLLKGQLRQMGFSNVQEAADGGKALELIQKQHDLKAPFDLIFSDWNMPNLTGIELLRKVRSTPEIMNTPFILITAEGEQSQVKEAIDLSVNSFIRKPFAPAVLKEKLEFVHKNLKKGA